jgi:hypothetical protein
MAHHTSAAASPSAVGAAILFFSGTVEQAGGAMTSTAWEIIVAGGWTIYLLLAVNRTTQPTVATAA